MILLDSNITIVLKWVMIHEYLLEILRNLMENSVVFIESRMDIVLKLFFKVKLLI